MSRIRTNCTDMSVLFHFVIVVFVVSGIRFSLSKSSNFQDEKSESNKSLSLSAYAKGKLANLQYLRNQFVQQQQKEEAQKTRLSNNINETSLQGNGTTSFSSSQDEEDEKELKTFITNPTDGRQHLWSSVIPNGDMLKRLSRMRKKLEPNLRTYLTTKYNDFLTNLVDYSDNIGVPPFVLNSMKIPQHFDPRWTVIEKLLETSSVDKFLSSLPDLTSLTKYKSADIVQGRSDDDFISDQEPQATSKGKKKYGGGLRLANRVKVYRKGEGEYGGSPQRTGYEYGNLGDQYGLYSHSSYDTSYGKGYDEYYSTKPTSEKGYSEYPAKAVSPKGLLGKYSQMVGFSSGAYGDNYGSAGHNSYSYGHGHGHGGGGGYGHGGGSGLTGYLDPFSILGGLAFLVYLGLLFQQSLNATGRAMPGSSIFEDTTWRKPIVLTQLSLSKEFKEPAHQRYGRSAEGVDTFDNLALQKLERFWFDVEGLSKIQTPICRLQETCHLAKDLYLLGLYPVFQEELEYYEPDKRFLAEVLKQLEKERGRFGCNLDEDGICDAEYQQLLFYNN